MLKETAFKLMKKMIYHFSKLFWIFPIDDKKIYLLNFDGTLIGHDAKAVFEWGRLNRAEYKFIWGVKNVEKIDIKVNNLTFVNINSIKGIYEILTSAAIVCNINPPSYFAYREKQKIINTWHGFIGKKIGKYIDGYDRRQFNLATCFMSETSTNTKNIRDAFEYNGYILECGVPRNDVFFSDSYNMKRIMIKEQYKTGEKHIALYAPTFRGNFKQKESELDVSRLLSALGSRFGGEWILFIKTHPMILNARRYTMDNVIDVSNHDDTQEVLCATDIVITDFSSVFYDFALTRKPVFLYFDDITEYGLDRGFLFSVYELPFSIATSNDDLEHNIQIFDEDRYLENLNVFLNKVGNFNNGIACECLFKYIESK